MATKKPTATAKPKTKAKVVAKPKTTVKTATKPVTKVPAKRVEEKTKTVKAESCFKGFFAKKYEEDESILTIFKKPKVYGALLFEVIGTMFISLIIFAALFFTIYNGVPLANTFSTYLLGIVAIYAAVHAISGAHLNPIVTAGMMATRRISVIRGVLYIIAQILGAWVAWMIFNSFHLAGGTTAMDVPTLSQIPEGGFGAAAVVELLGALIVGFFFARAFAYRKRSPFTYAVIIAGGLTVALFLGYIVSATFLQAQSNFVFNPAAALMLQIFPTAGESFGEVFGGICSALAVFAIFPMIGGVLGAYLSEFAGKLSGEKEA